MSGSICTAQSCKEWCTLKHETGFAFQHSCFVLIQRIKKPYLLRCQKVTYQWNFLDIRPIPEWKYFSRRHCNFWKKTKIESLWTYYPLLSCRKKRSDEIQACKVKPRLSVWVVEEVVDSTFTIIIDF